MRRLEVKKKVLELERGLRASGYQVLGGGWGSRGTGPHKLQIPVVVSLPASHISDGSSLSTVEMVPCPVLPRLVPHSVPQSRYSSNALHGSICLSLAFVFYFYFLGFFFWGGVYPSVLRIYF